MKYLLMLMLLAVAAVGQTPQAQDGIKHAPTAEQCRADAHLWTAQLKGKFVEVTYTELGARADEMNDCFSVDTDNRVLYLSEEAFFIRVQRVRLTQFIEKHNLAQEFAHDEALGAR